MSRLSFLVALLVLGAAFVTVPGPTAPVAALHAETLVCPHVADRPILDGIVSPGEYGETYRDNATGLALHMQYEADNLSLAVESPGQGWVSIHLTGLDPGMPGEDMLLGYVDNGTTVLDMIDHGWEVHMDVDVGGSQDVLATAGQRNGFGTIIEMTVPLNSADPNDHHFEALGTYAFRLGYNDTSAQVTAPPTAHTEAQTFTVAARPLPPAVATVLSLEAQGDAWEGGLLVLYSRLATEQGAPLADQVVSLYQETTFGKLLLDERLTDRDGEAEHLVSTLSRGSLTLVGSFPGGVDFTPANVTLTLAIAAGPPLTVPFPTTTMIVLVVSIVVGSIWATYALVGLQVYRISRPKGVRAAREVEEANEPEKRR